MPTARVTRPQATATSSVPPIAPPVTSEKFGQRTRRIFNKRDAGATSNDNTNTAFTTRPITREQPSQPDACIQATIYIKLMMILEVIFVWDGGFHTLVSIQ